MELIRVRRKEADKIKLHDDIAIHLSWNSNDGLTDVLLINKSTGETIKFAQGQYSEASVFIREREREVTGYVVKYNLAGKEKEEFYATSDAAYDRQNKLESSLSGSILVEAATRIEKIF